MSVDTWYPAGHNNWCSVNLTPECFAFKVNNPVAADLDFYSACDYTAKKLYSDFSNRQLYLSLSGGLDSELVADTFIRNQIPFIPVIVKIGHINIAESWYAEYWCNKNNVKPIVINLTTKDYEEILKKYLVSTLRHTHQIGCIGNFYVADFVQALGGYCVTGVGDINQDNDQFYINTVDFSLNIFKPNQHPTGFFMYTPEIALAYILQFDPLQDEQYNKLSFYNISPRPKIDWTFEVIHMSERISTMLKTWMKKVPKSQPHWFGNKQNVINILKGIQ
jgi:hypothetical protein